VQRGLLQIIPEEALALVSPQTMGRLVCGTPHVNVELLKRHTEYSECSAQDPHIINFWTVMSEFSQAELRRFIKFTWAQERLPSDDDGFYREGQKIRMMIKARVSKKHGDDKKVDDVFPRADTCFFNLELPAYSTLEVMKEKITTVINLDSGMDGDDNAEIQDGFGIAQDNMDEEL